MELESRRAAVTHNPSGKRRFPSSAFADSPGPWPRCDACWLNLASPARDAISEGERSRRAAGAVRSGVVSQLPNARPTKSEAEKAFLQVGNRTRGLYLEEVKLWPSNGTHSPSASGRTTSGTKPMISVPGAPIGRREKGRLRNQTQTRPRKNHRVLCRKSRDFDDSTPFRIFTRRNESITRLA